MYTGFHARSFAFVPAAICWVLVCCGHINISQKARGIEDGPLGAEMPMHASVRCSTEMTLWGDGKLPLYGFWQVCTPPVSKQL